MAVAAALVPVMSVRLVGPWAAGCTADTLLQWRFSKKLAIPKAANGVANSEFVAEFPPSAKSYCFSSLIAAYRAEPLQQQGLVQPAN